jgi:hypothetical protein
MALRKIMASATVLMLAACGASADNVTAANAAGDAEVNAVAPASTENEAAPALENTAAPAPAAMASAGAAPTRDYIVGKWGENGDCKLAIEFRADGTMVGPFERWELDGGRLTMVGAPEPMTLSVIDKDTMESRLGTGAARRITRC